MTQQTVLSSWLDRRLARETKLREAARLRALAAEHEANGRLAAWCQCVQRARRIEREARA